MPTVQQPDWNQQPIFNSTFAYNLAEGDDCEAIDIDPRKSEYCPDFSSVATGGGDVFISSSGLHDPARVQIYDGTTLAHKRTIERSDMDLPRGIAWYKGELFVLDAAAQNVLVFDPATGGLKRTIAHPAKAVIAGNYVESVMLTGIDAAWNELWITFRGGLGGGGITVIDAQTGAPKGIQWHEPRLDSTRSAWWDIATVPEVSGVLAQCRFISRVDVAHPIPVDEVQLDELGGTNACATSTQEQGGVDAVWGMRWFMVVQEPREGRGPLRINEYGIEDGGATAPRLSPLRRTWRPRMTEENEGEYLHHDVAYQARDARIDWDGPFTTQNWLRGTHCTNYIVSDADIYVAGQEAERWYEPARGFQRIELQVDGVTKQSQTTPSGQFCFDTNSMPSGTHTVSLKAWVNNGTKTATISNASTNFDHNGPVGAVTSPGAVVTGPVTVKGTMQDPHSGSKEWSLEASLAGGAWKTVCTLPGDTQGVNQWAPECLWAAGTPDYPEGVYQLRSRMTDLVGPAYGGSNVSYSAPVTVRVDKTPPTATFSGELKDAEDLTPLYDDDAPAVTVTASDSPGAGVRRVELYVDSVQRDFAEQPCAGGGCGMTRTFTIRPADYADGNHTVTVRAIDHAGLSRDWQWEISIEKLFAPDPEGTDIPAGISDPAGRSAMLSAGLTNGGLFGNSAAADESPIPAEELLACDSEAGPTSFPVYSVGPVFEGLPMTTTYRRCDVPWPEEVERANFVSFIYGSCTPPAGIDVGGCAPPLEVQSWPTCERNLASIQPMPDGQTLQYSQIQVNGAPAASFDDGLQVEVFTGRTTVVVFGADAAQVLRAAAAIQAQPSDDPLAFPAKASSADPLPAPLPGIVEGGIPCV